MQVTLVRPSYVIPKKSVFGHRGVPALGLAYLSATLKADRHNVTCIDGFGRDIDNFLPIEKTDLVINGLSNDSIIALIPQSNIIGISSMFSSDWINTSELIISIRKNHPDSFIVLGGEHATADYEHILKNYPAIDACILGEGEFKLKNLANKIASGEKKRENIEGISYFNRETNTIVTNPFDYRIKDINSIAPPDWESLSIENFHERGMGMSMQGKITMPMILSRGCPYQCTFCSSKDMWTTRWVPRDVNLVIEEIKKYQKQYNINHLDFFDLTAIVNKKWTIDFCNQLIKEKINLSWSLPSGTRSEALDFEVLKLLRESGCNKLTYAPETGSARMSKLIKKRVDLENMLKSMRIAVKLKIIVKANIIFGFPEEKISDVLYNFLYLFRMALAGVHDVPCFGFTPYPGSELFDRLLKSGKIKKDENYNLFLANLVYSRPFNPYSWSDSFSINIIPLLSLGGMAFFYTCQFVFRPWRFFIMAKNLILKTPNTMLDIALSNMLRNFLPTKNDKPTKCELQQKIVTQVSEDQFSRSA